MESDLSFILTENIFVFIMIFARFGAAIMVMPGFGDFFTPVQIRLLFAVSLSFMLTSVFYQKFPTMPDNSVVLAMAIGYEFFNGALIGIMTRILMSALDTAGMIISIQTGLGSAQIFNPGAQTQGSLVGTFFYLFGVILIFATNMHHMMLYTIYESYQLMPPLVSPQLGAVSDFVAQAISHSFIIGFKLSLPFIVLGIIMYSAMGIMGRLMPQVQIFILALPMQIIVGLMTLGVTVSAIMLYWLRTFEDGMALFLGQ